MRDLVVRRGWREQSKAAAGVVQFWRRRRADVRFDCAAADVSVFSREEEEDVDEANAARRLHNRMMLFLLLSSLGAVVWVVYVPAV